MIGVYAYNAAAANAQDDDCGEKKGPKRRWKKERREEDGQAENRPEEERTQEDCGQEDRTQEDRGQEKREEERCAEKDQPQDRFQLRQKDDQAQIVHCQAEREEESGSGARQVAENQVADSKSRSAARLAPV